MNAVGESVRITLVGGAMSRNARGVNGKNKKRDARPVGKDGQLHQVNPGVRWGHMVAMEYMYSGVSEPLAWGLATQVRKGDVGRNCNVS